MDGQISSGSGKSTNVAIELKHLTPQEKRSVALKSLALFWALSIGSIPLPPIHWVTVPGFFLFGIYMFFKKLREPTHLRPLTAKCPECGQDIAIKEQVAESPLSLACPNCHYSLRLEWDSPK